MKGTYTWVKGAKKKDTYTWFKGAKGQITNTSVKGQRDKGSSMKCTVLLLRSRGQIELTLGSRGQDERYLHLGQGDKMKGTYTWVKGAKMKVPSPEPQIAIPKRINK